MKKKFYFKRVVFLTVLLTTKFVCGQEFEFQGLGIINNQPGAISHAFGVSDDGLIVTGVTTSFFQGQNAGEAYRWENGVMTGIGFHNPPEDLVPTSYGTAISGDGMFIVSYGRSAVSNWEAFLWMNGEGMMALGCPQGDPCFAEPRGISNNGQIAVGRDLNVPITALRWANGEVEHLVDENSHMAEAWGISGDGEVIVGQGEINGSYNQAMMWRTGEGFFPLGTPEGEMSVAFGVNADGTVIVGRKIHAIGEDSFFNAFRWTQQEGMITLGFLDENREYAEAKAVSDDGTTIVGMSDTDDGLRAFVWTEETGMLNIQELLQSHGIDLTGWKLYEATAVSADGKTIVGNGINPNNQHEAWRAVLNGNLSVAFNLSEKEISLYPNPTTGIINLNTEGVIENIVIYNISGQKIEIPFWKGQNDFIDFTGFSNGIYFVEVTIDGYTSNHKIIKK